MDIQVRVLPELSSMLMAWAVLLMLYLLLRKLLYEPISKVLRERQERIEKEIDDAKITNEEAEALKLEYTSRLNNAKEESQQIVEAARVRGKELEASIIAEARDEAEKIKERARRDIELEKETAFLDLKKDAGEMALLIASKIMQEEIDMENQSQLIDRFIDEVGNEKWEN